MLKCGNGSTETELWNRNSNPVDQLVCMCVAVTIQDSRESYLPYCPHLHVRAYPPISTVLWFVSRVTAYHSKFLHGDSKVHRWRDCFDEFQAPLHPAAHTGHNLVHSIFRLQYEIRILRAISMHCEALATRLHVRWFSSRI